MLAPYLTTTSSLPWFVAHALYAHYLLVNIAYHYFRVVVTSPGHPPKNGLDGALILVLLWEGPRILRCY